MSTFTETITLDLGPAYAGATLRAQWYNVATGADEGSAISAGFVEIGGGRYDFTDEFTLAAGERQGVKFYEDGAPGTILARSIVSQLATSTPFTETIPLDLGGAYAGILADLRAQWYDETTGTDVGAAISTGFIEIGGGMYDFTDEFDLEDGESQGVKFYDIGDPATILARSVITSELSAMVTHDWYYADEEAVENLLGTLNLQIGGDIDSDGDLDTGLVQRDGEWSDGYIDLELARAGLSVPVDLNTADDHIISTLEDISAHLVVWYIWHHRGLTDPRFGDPNAIAGIMQGYKAYADEQLAKLIEVMAAEDEDDDATSVGEFGSVTINRDYCTSDDENSQ